MNTATEKMYKEMMMNNRFAKLANMMGRNAHVILEMRTAAEKKDFFISSWLTEEGKKSIAENEEFEHIMLEIEFFLNLWNKEIEEENEKSKLIAQRVVAIDNLIAKMA